jgi:histidyl-tRNA synthetase
MSGEETQARPAESQIGLVKGTADVLPDEFARLAGLQGILLERFSRAGYRPIRVPVLEARELHERKSGARIVANLYQLNGGDDSVCLRPEVTAGIVRAYVDAPGPPPLPWRVSYAGPVFRHLPTGPGVLREFHQVGVERIDEPGSIGGDAEAIWLADWGLTGAGIGDATIRIGHAGLIQELLRRSGLPLGVQVALVEVLAEASQADGGDANGERVLAAAETHLDSLAGWLGSGGTEAAIPAEDAGADRLFRTLYPEVVGRRSGRDIIGRIRRKWDLGHGLAGVLAKVREQIRSLADLRGPAVDVLERMRRFEDSVPELTRELTGLVEGLRGYGIDPARVELDLGFGRGIGFYSQMVFVLIAQTAAGPVEVCGGGRYDGLARALGSDRDVGGVGFAFGLERLRATLDARGKPPAPVPSRGMTLLAAWGPPAYGLAVALRMRGMAIVVEEGKAGESVSTESARARGFAHLIRVEGDSLHLIELATGKMTRAASLDDLIRLLEGGAS